MSILQVATCQFPVSASPEANLGHIKRQLRTSWPGGC
jgi:hypothetical protein